jgi:hypothetical protein
MVRLDAPNLEAGLYWRQEDPQLSFRRVCQLLIQQGMTTADCGAFAAPEDTLLALLEQPESDIRAASFITSSKNRSRARPTHRPPSKLIVSYGLLSDAATGRGDHPAIQVAWGGSSFFGPVGYSGKDASVKGLQAYHFFTHLCAELDPLYAALQAEMEVPCLYDFLHPHKAKSYSHLPLSEFYFREGVLGDAEETFWRMYAYSERLPHGTYGSDYPLMNPRRRSLGGDAAYRNRVHAERRTMLTSSLKRISHAGDSA